MIMILTESLCAEYETRRIHKIFLINKLPSTRNDFFLHNIICKVQVI